MTQDTFLIDLHAKYEIELAKSEMALFEAAQKLHWLLSLPKKSKKRRIDQQTYLASRCGYTYLAHVNGKSYLNANAYNASEILWLPVNKSWRVKRYRVDFPWGYAIESDDNMSQAEYVTWINRLDPYHYSHQSLIELIYVLTQPTGYSYNFHGNHRNPWQFTVL